MWRNLSHHDFIDNPYLRGIAAFWRGGVVKKAGLEPATSAYVYAATLPSELLLGVLWSD